VSAVMNLRVHAHVVSVTIHSTPRSHTERKTERTVLV
jgi:hypothetical protein